METEKNMKLLLVTSTSVNMHKTTRLILCGLLLHMYQGTFHENTHSDAFLSLLPKNRALWVKVAKLET